MATLTGIPSFVQNLVNRSHLNFFGSMRNNEKGSEETETTTDYSVCTKSFSQKGYSEKSTGGIAMNNIWAMGEHG
jgi:hypothetical protein